MSVRNQKDEGFDSYRKERKRMQAKLGPQHSAAGYENQALRELEQVEAAEVRDQQLTREVHEFFATATKQAATIVDRVARDAEAEAGQKVEQEMEAFLIDALSRMNTFVLAVLQQKRGPVAETQLEPKVTNLVGASLDEFRWAGTADIGDKHIGQDPFATPVDDVRREFRAVTGGSDGSDNPEALPIEQHMVAAVDDASDEAPVATKAKVAPAARAPKLAAPASPANKPAATPVAAVPPETQPAAEASTADGRQAELDRFKNALKALVRQGVMSREEARAAWLARLQSLGLAG